MNDTNFLQKALRQRLTVRAAFCLLVLVAAFCCCVGLCVVLLGMLHGLQTLPALPVAVSLALVGAATARFGRWLWAPPPPCYGIELPDAAAPRFRRRIDRLCARLGARRVDRIVVTPDINAAINCRPSCGIGGRMHTTLTVGIPLSHSLTPQQLTAVLAHELAHLAAQRDGPGAWSAHLRTWWLRTYDRIDEDASVPGALARLLFGPAARIDLRQSLALSRLDEFEADALAARAIGADALAGALLEVAMKDHFLTENYWLKVMDQARHRRRPSFRPFRDMGYGMQAGFVRQDALAGLDRHLAGNARSKDTDTHPSLAERLEALQVAGLTEPEVPDGPSAAQHYFAPVLPELSLAFDRMWWDASAQDWRTRYRTARRERRR